MTTLVNGLPVQINALVEEFVSYIGKIDDLNYRAKNPVCGKPGKGFKAARKAAAALRDAEINQNKIWHEIEMYIRTSNKMSYADAERRRARIKAAIDAMLEKA